MILYILLLLLILSLESVLGLPLFFLYLSHVYFERKSEKLRLVAILISALLLAIFYHVSWPVIAILLFVYYLLSQQFGKKILLSLLFFVLLNILFFLIAKLQFNYFYLVHLAVFAFYFYKTNFRKYAS